MRSSGVSLVAVTTGTPLAPSIYTWTFGDGTPDETTGTGSSGHTYAQAGDFTASVALADGSGRTARSTRVITVSSPPRAPTTPAPGPTAPAGFVVSLACAPRSAGNATPCNVSVSYNGVRLPSEAVKNVDWDWGDGEINSDHQAGGRAYLHRRRAVHGLRDRHRHNEGGIEDDDGFKEHRRNVKPNN